jgi:phage gp36-like protein
VAVTALYCSITDVQNRLSAAGVTARVDDTPPTSNGDVLDEASRIVDEHAYLLYGANLTLSTVVKHWTANIAAYLLCERRGNGVPKGIAEKYDRAMESLKRVLKNGRQIPDIAQLKTACPVLSNQRVRLDPNPRVVTETSKSTGTPAGYVQNQDTLDPPNYII